MSIVLSSYYIDVARSYHKLRQVRDLPSRKKNQLLIKKVVDKWQAPSYNIIKEDGKPLVNQKPDKRQVVKRRKIK